MDTVVLRLEDVVVLDVVLVVSLLAVVSVLAVVPLGVTLLGGFGLEILETVIPPVRILTPLGDTDWERGGSEIGDELFLKSETVPGGDVTPTRGTELLVELLAAGGGGFFMEVDGIFVWGEGGGGSSTSS